MRPDNLIGFVGRLFVEPDRITAGHQPPDPVMGDQLDGASPAFKAGVSRLYVFLVFDVLLHDGERGAAHGGDEVAVGP